MEIVNLYSDNKKYSINKELLLFYPYFKDILDDSCDQVYRFDIDANILYDLIELIRNGEEYECSNYVLSTFEQIVNSNYIPEKWITLNIGGKYFVTTSKTLCKLNYFSSLKNWNQNIPTYIDRSYKAFKHILSYLRNPNYIIPQKFHYEFKFYGVNYSNNIDFIELPNDINIKNSINNLDNNVNNNVNNIVNNIGLNNTIDLNNTINLDNTINTFLTSSPLVTFHKKRYNRYFRFMRNYNIIKSKNIENHIIFKIEYDLRLMGDMFIIFPLNKLNMYDISDKIKISDIIDKIIVKIDNDFVLFERTGKIIDTLMDFYINQKLIVGKNKFVVGLNNGYLYIPLFPYWIISSGLAFPQITLNKSISVHVFLSKKNHLYIEGNLYYENINLLSNDEIEKFTSSSLQYLVKDWKEFSFNFNSNQIVFKSYVQKGIDSILLSIDSDECPENILKCAKIFDSNKKLLYYADSIISNNNLLSVASHIPDNTYLLQFSYDLYDSQPSGTLIDTNDLFIELQLNNNNGIINIMYYSYNIMNIYNNKCEYVFQ